MYKLNTRIKTERALAQPVKACYATKLLVNNGYQIESKNIIVSSTYAGT